jgi:hypothetical protein
VKDTNVDIKITYKKLRFANSNLEENILRYFLTRERERNITLVLLLLFLHGLLNSYVYLAAGSKNRMFNEY